MDLAALADLKPADAAKMLAALDLVLGKQTPKYDEKIKKGLVIGPATIDPTTQLKRGTVVDVFVSKGKKPIKVPDYVGKPGADAIAAALDSGYSRRAMRSLHVSYVTKKMDAPGALPTATLPMPRYTPRKPPLLQKPCALCRRVLIVSIG